MTTGIYIKCRHICTFSHLEKLFTFVIQIYNERTLILLPLEMETKICNGKEYSFLEIHINKISTSIYHCSLQMHQHNHITNHHFNTSKIHMFILLSGWIINYWSWEKLSVWHSLLQLILTIRILSFNWNKSKN